MRGKDGHWDDAFWVMKIMQEFEIILLAVWGWVAACGVVHPARYRFCPANKSGRISFNDFERAKRIGGWAGQTGI